MERDARAGSRRYLEFADDPLLPAGVAAELEAKKVADGWRKVTLDEDVYVTAQFRNRDGRRYSSDGWARKGTTVFVLPQRGRPTVFDGFGVVQMCGNPIIVGEEKYGW